jgi:Rieske Fe-S protein
MRESKPATSTTDPHDLAAPTVTTGQDHRPSQSPFGPAGSGPTRRNLLRAAGLVALVGGGSAALAACSSADTSAPTPNTAPSSAAPSSPASPASSSAPSASASASASASESSSAAVPDGPSVTTGEVPVGGGVILQDADYVVTQPEKGSYKAFSKICTHQGCPVSQIVDKEIVCNCHGSHFSISDGSVLSGPADKALAEAKTTVAGGKVVVTA